MACYEIVECVPEDSRDEPCRRGETPGTSEVPGHLQRGRRPSQDPFTRAGTRRLVPHDRIHLCELGVSGANRTAEDTVEGREPEDAPAIMAQDELHALGTESAGAIVQQDRSRWFHMFPIRLGVRGR